MAKPTGGLLAFDARGSIAKTMVYSSWRGRPYVRRWTAPANPQTVSQMSTRNVFGWLSAVWKRASTDFQAPWTAYALGQPLTDRNAFGKFNIPPLVPATDLADFIFSPGAKGGPGVVSTVVTPGSHTLAVAVTAPALPTGWTIMQAVVAAIPDQDPHTDVLYTVTSGVDTTSAYSVTLSGLTSSILYRVGAWLVWNKPDGSLAYGPSLLTSGTPS